MADYAMVNKDTGLVENMIHFDDHLYLVEITAENANIQPGGTMVNGAFVPAPTPPAPATE